MSCLFCDKSGTTDQRILTVEDISKKAARYRNEKKEFLLGFYLNARHILIKKEVISIGILTASLAHPREIFSAGVRCAAAALILVHNHPSGDSTPSEEDNRLTQRIKQAGLIMGIELIDHLIVAKNGCYSFKRAGVL